MRVNMTRWNLRAVIFDMDGVIIDSHPTHRRAWNEFLQTLGCQVSDHELDFILEGRKRSDILRHFLGDLPEPELAAYGEKKDEFFHRICPEVDPLPGVIDLIRNLETNDICMAVATSGSRTRTRSTLDRLGVAHCFQVVVTGDDVPAGKPDPGMYQLACRQLHVDPQQVVAIEDAASGIQAATAAGICCIGVIGDGGSAQRLQAAGAKHLIDNFLGVGVEQLNRILSTNMVVPNYNSANAPHFL
ncbi:MAG TPA: HAD family phosphatase [Terriglobales bacterium]|nr:HAD family phosphatase [Terriglobales bacterium]